MMFLASPAPEDGCCVITLLACIPRGHFQSSPISKDGRSNGMSVSQWYAISEFQSSPAPEDGRCRQFATGNITTQRVSILARPRGRALRLMVGFGLGDFTFQSSPAPED